MIFDLWPLPKAPGGGDPKNCAVACAIMIHVSKHTPTLVEFQKKN